MKGMNTRSVFRPMNHRCQGSGDVLDELGEPEHPPLALRNAVEDALDTKEDSLRTRSDEPDRAPSIQSAHCPRTPGRGAYV